MSQDEHVVALDSQYKGSFKAPEYRSEATPQKPSVDKDSGVDVK